MIVGARQNMSNAAINHLRSLTRILEDLEEERIELFEYEYHPLAFGSFQIIVGRSHEKLKFTWDGRESILSVSFGSVTNKKDIPNWTHDADVSLPYGEGVFEEIASQSVYMLKNK